LMNLLVRLCWFASLVRLAGSPGFGE